MKGSSLKTLVSLRCVLGVVILGVLYFIAGGVIQGESLYFVPKGLMPEEEDRLVNVKLDPEGQYGVGVTAIGEEVFLLVWTLRQGDVLYTTRGKARYPRGFTWAGQKLVYIGLEGISYMYELDPPIKPHVPKVFLFDPNSNQEKILSIPFRYSPGPIYTCGDDTILLFDESIGYPPECLCRIYWYSISREIKIHEMEVAVGRYFGWSSSQGAHLLYCSPDHRRMWVVTYLFSHILPSIGYGPTPVPVLLVIENGKKRVLMDPEKECLESRESVRFLRVEKGEEIFAAITVRERKGFGRHERYLVHFSPQREVWRKRLDLEKLKAKGFEWVDLLWIGGDGRTLLCEEYKKERRIFWWDVVSGHTKVIARDVKDLELIRVRPDKLWLKEIPRGKFLDVEID